MKYLIHKRKKKRKAHLWNGNDTCCKMYSSGGLVKDFYMVIDEIFNEIICKICLEKSSEKTYKYIEKNADYVISEDTYLHRRISEKFDGPIPRGYHVHHCDHEKLNNSIQNLVQIPQQLHYEIHSNYTKSNSPNKKTILEVLLPEYLSRKYIILPSINNTI